MSAAALIEAFLRETGHGVRCGLLAGPGCTCGQVERLKDVRAEAARWLRAQRASG